MEARRPWPEVRFIYAIREDRPKGLIKIGSATNVMKRLQTLRRDVERPLVLDRVVAWVGSHTRVAEAIIHHQLEPYRAPIRAIERRGFKGRREWFYPKPEMFEYIKAWPTDLATALAVEPSRLAYRDEYPNVPFG